MESCDRIVVMARGEIVADRPVRETSIDEIQEVMRCTTLAFAPF
jgi:ABC-type sugar transport system ATPase subunit